jgi:hypothetical protein
VLRQSEHLAQMVVVRVPVVLGEDLEASEGAFVDDKDAQMLSKLAVVLEWGSESVQVQVV